MSILQVRQATPADARELAAFAARSFEETYAGDIPAEHIREHLQSAFGVSQQTRELNDGNMVTLLAHRDGALVAYAQLRRQAPPQGIELDAPVELQRFYVDRPAQGTGVARELMAAVHALAASLGGRNLWLGVWERNPRAIAFYRKSGFREAGTTDFCVGSDRQTDRVLVATVGPLAQDAR